MVTQAKNRKENRAEQSGSGIGPIVDDVDIQSLYEEQSYEIQTQDGWTLVMTRYKPIPQVWHQPLLHEPLMCVHGFSQNRYAWITGEFAKNMLYFGADLHILELRGHGRSSRRLQREIAEETGRPLPANFDFEWSLDDYFLYDLPAAIEAVKRETGADRIFYCGHSMGGMLGYGLASLRDDIAGMITVGSPSELGKESLPIRLAARLGYAYPAFRGLVDAFNSSRQIQYDSLYGLARKLRNIPGMQLLSEEMLKIDAPVELRPKVVRMDLFLQLIYNFVRITDQEGNWIPKPFRIFNPQKHISGDLEWILTEGGEKEPIGVLLQFIRWINHGEMKCYASGHDFQENFKNIHIPVTIIFGDEDFLAGVKSTRRIYNEVSSNYVVWRPVRGNSHLEITMGADIRQICYDIKNLMEFAKAHQNRSPRLPRFRHVEKAS